jgi:undecaprenyl-diphosphatase
MSLFHSFILGIVQGITEFFPISSSAHLALLQEIFGIQSKLQVTIFLHFGSVLALLLTMRSEIKEIVTKKLRLIPLLVIGSIPAGIVGFTLKSKIELSFENPIIIGTSLVLTGIILWFTRVRSHNIPRARQITLLDALIIGIAQAIAIIPGISRSGITIAMAIYLGINRVEAAKFSFLLAIISILGATVFTLPSSQLLTFDFTTIITAILVSFLASYFAIRTLLKVVSTRKFSLFSLYCWLLGFLVLFLNL